MVVGIGFALIPIDAVASRNHTLKTTRPSILQLVTKEKVEKNNNRGKQSHKAKLH